MQSEEADHSLWQTGLKISIPMTGFRNMLLTAILLFVPSIENKLYTEIYQLYLQLLKDSLIWNEFIIPLYSKTKAMNEAKEYINAMQALRAGLRNYIRKKLRESNLDLTYEMLQVLAVLWRRGDVNQQEIADGLSKSKASLTSLLDNLSKRKLIVRTEDPSDRRNKIISLTKVGRGHEKELDALMNDVYHTLQVTVPAGEIKNATMVMKRMANNLEK